MSKIKRTKEREEKLKSIEEKNRILLWEKGLDAEEGFEYKGIWIGVFSMDETGRFKVNPEKYYGEPFVKFYNSL